ncbi:serine hydrolase domain-containing protein [Flavobacteriaceae bacterium GF1]
MKKIRLDKPKRRLLRSIGFVFCIWLGWNIYDHTTWVLFPKDDYPFTTMIANNAYVSQIQKAEKWMKGVAKRLDVPSFSIAVGHQGNIIWSAAEGYAHMKSLRPATPRTQYRIGSTSKAITATGIALLVNAGSIPLDNYLGDTITNWPKKRWNFTTRQLLSHTAGIGNYEDFGIASARYTLCNCHQFTSASEGIKVFNRYPLLYRPGTDFKYSSFDVNLASVVLEQAANQPFLDYMQEHVFHPLTMDNTYADHTRLETQHLATFYETSKNHYREYRTMGILDDVNLSYKWAGGGFISTPTDLVKMGNAWLSGPSFLSSATLKEFWTPVQLDDGSINEQEYALGWRSWLAYQSDEILNNTPVWMVHHGGVSKGSMNFLVIFPQYDLVINASMNARAHTFGEFAKEVRRLANCFLTDLTKQPLPLYTEIKAKTFP